MENTHEPDQTKKLEELTDKDDSIVFVLAALMVDLYTATVLRNDKAIGILLEKTGQLLKGNPGFPARFKALQKEVLKKSGMELPTTPPNSGIILP